MPSWEFSRNLLFCREPVVPASVKRDFTADVLSGIFLNGKHVRLKVVVYRAAIYWKIAPSDLFLDVFRNFQNTFKKFVKKVHFWKCWLKPIDCKPATPNKRIRTKKHFFGLQDVLKSSSRYVLNTSWNIFSVRISCFPRLTIFCLPRYLQYVLRTSWRRYSDAF